MLTTAIRLDLIVHRERGTEVMDGDVERRFAVFLQQHCTVKVEVVRGIRQRLFIIVFRLPAKRNRSTMNPNSRAT
jgi:hypothetical protein